MVYYSVDFPKYEPQGLINNDLLFEEANSSHFLLIDKLVKAIFKGYTNHYNSNPYLRKDDITEGYVEWVKNYIGGENKKVFLIYRNSEPIAFATCHNQNDIAEGVLYGVLPEHSGGGVYSDIIRYTQKYYQQSGAKSMEVSTQVQNYAVQKVWNREGFKLSRSYATIHINSLLNYSIEPQREYKQDLNKDRIDSSADCLAEILRILSQEYPGSGTIFLTNKNSFLKPLDGNEPYKIVQNLIAFDENNKIYKFNMTVYNSENEVCLLSENDVIKK